MILSDRAIMALLQKGTLSISPLKEQQIQPASVDIRLGDTFSIVEDSSAPILTLSQEMAYKEIRAEKYLLMPGQFVLATTMEYIKLPDDLTAFVEGRSSLGRMGLFIQNAGWVDPGFQAKSRWNCLMRTAVRSNCGRDAESGNWFLRRWIRLRCILTAANIRGSGAPQAPKFIWTTSPETYFP